MVKTKPTRRRRIGILALPLALVLSSGLVYRASTAAFTATTTNGTNQWTAGTVALTDDDSGGVMFTASGLTPGSTGSRCIVVTYNGSVTSDVKLYTTSLTNSDGAFPMAAMLDLVITRGSGSTFAGSSGGCGALTGSQSVYTGTLAGLGASFAASGASAWSPTGSGQTMVYRIQYTLNAAADDNYQGDNVQTTFTWEAQSV